MKLRRSPLKRTRTSWLARALATLAVSGTLVAASVPARAMIVERVVAVVGERSILLSDLKHRARPYLFHIYGSTQNPTQQAAQETEMYREVLNRMIDDRLEEQAADKAHLTVTADEIDRGIKQKADSINLSTRQLLAEAKRQGLSESDYRDEIRRQVLEGKLVQLRVMSRVRVTEEDARAAYAHWLKESKEQGGEAVVDVRILARRVPQGATDADVAATETFARELAERARHGEDFCKLVEQYTEDPSTKATCGSRGLQQVVNLLAPIADAIAGLKKGQVAEPVTFGREAVLVIQVARPPGVPLFEEVREPMRDRAMGEVIERQRKAWLQELRRGVYVDVRL